MSSVVNAIKNVVAIVVSIATLTITVYIAIFDVATGNKSFEESMADSLEHIFGFFGLNGEDVISTDVLDTRLLEDTLDIMPVELALLHMKTQEGVIDILRAKTMSAKLTYNKVFDYAKSSYVDGLPYSNITADIFPVAATIANINAAYSVVCELENYRIGVPSKEEYAYFKLKELYGFNMTTGELPYSGDVYYIDYIEYNYTNDKYDIHVYPADIITTTTTTTTQITISNIDASYDKKNTTVTERIITYSEVSGLVSDITTEIRNTNKLIPINSESNSTVVVDYIQDNREIIAIEAFGTFNHYIAKWNEVGSTDYNMWMYVVGSGDVSLDATLLTSNLDMLPIITIRNNGVDVTNDKTSARYAQSKTMMDAIGLDIDGMVGAIKENPDADKVVDVFVYFGIDLSDTSPVIAKMIYKVVDYVLGNEDIPSELTVNTSYDGLGDFTQYDNNRNSYNITVTEGPFNSALSWAYQTKKVINGVLGPINTYENEPNGINLVVRRQVTLTEYIEYELYNIFAVTSIDRDGLSAVVTRSYASSSMIMPLSYDVISDFSPIEQLDLFAKSLRMVSYAAQITHLKWYQTEGFIATLKVFITVIGIVLFVLSLPAGGSAGTVWFAWAMTMLAMIGGGLLLMQAIKSTSIPWLKALYIAIAVVIMSYTGYGGDLLQMTLFVVSQVSFAVTDWAETMTEGIRNAAIAFGEVAADRYEEIQAAWDSMGQGISTDFAERLSNVEEVNSYVEGPSLGIYEAVQLQYDAIELAVSDAYTDLFEYDHYYKIGVQ